MFRGLDTPRLLQVEVASVTFDQYVIALAKAVIAAALNEAGEVLIGRPTQVHS